MSAVARTSASVTLQPNAFHWFQPIGGVRANPLSQAYAGGAAPAIAMAPAANEALASSENIRRIGTPGWSGAVGSAQAVRFVLKRRPDRPDGQCPHRLEAARSRRSTPV